jgi:hypothetical protein
MGYGRPAMDLHPEHGGPRGVRDLPIVSACRWIVDRVQLRFVVTARRFLELARPAGLEPAATGLEGLHGDARETSRLFPKGP